MSTVNSRRTTKELTYLRNNDPRKRRNFTRKKKKVAFTVMKAPPNSTTATMARMSREQATLKSSDKVATKCKAIHTQEAIDKFWKSLHQKFKTAFMKNSADARKYKNNPSVIKQIMKHRKLLRRELGRAESMIQTCSSKHSLQNPTFKLSVED